MQSLQNKCSILHEPYRAFQSLGGIILCPGGICPGNIYVLGCMCPGCKCPGGNCLPFGYINLQSLIFLNSPVYIDVSLMGRIGQSDVL